MKMALIDLTGQRFGKIVVVKKTEKKTKGNVWKWECLCDCGNTKEILGHSLRMGITRSCGCLAKEKVAAKNREQSRENHYRWKGGRVARKDGYMLVLDHDHPKANPMGYVLEHVVVAERALGEYLPEGSIIHHINGKRDDNRLENLWWFPSQSEHSKHHQELRHAN